jgi:hypothetical protein
MRGAEGTRSPLIRRTSRDDIMRLVALDDCVPYGSGLAFGAVSMVRRTGD